MRRQRELEQAVSMVERVVRDSQDNFGEEHMNQIAPPEAPPTVEQLLEAATPSGLQRLEAAAYAGVIDAAVDAATSGRAENSLEKMLCHQMAAAHFSAMKLIARAADTRLPPVEMARLTNASARLMDSYQSALLALHRIRTGGKQTVVVQHVQVSDGGQAVITGNMKTGGHGGGRVQGNG